MKLVESGCLERCLRAGSMELLGSCSTELVGSRCLERCLRAGSTELVGSCSTELVDDIGQVAAFTLGSLVEGLGPNQIVQRRWGYSNHSRMVGGN